MAVTWGELAKFINQLIKQGKIVRYVGGVLTGPDGATITAAVTEASIVAAGPFLRSVLNGDGSVSIKLSDNSILSFVQPTYKLSTQTISGISNLPDPALEPPGSVVRLHADNFVGEGSNKKGIRMIADPVNACWVPDGPQVLFASLWGNLASGYKTVSPNNSTVKFNIGTDPIIPGGLIVPLRSRLVIEFRYRKIGGVYQPTVAGFLGTDLVTYSTNSTIYSQTVVTTANYDVPAKSEIDFPTTTTALCSNRAATGGSGAAGAQLDASTQLNTAANMLVAFNATLATNTDEVRAYKYRILLEPT